LPEDVTLEPFLKEVTEQDRPAKHQEVGDRSLAIDPRDVQVAAQPTDEIGPRRRLGLLVALALFAERPERFKDTSCKNEDRAAELVKWDRSRNQRQFLIARAAPPNSTEPCAARRVRTSISPGTP
jgi:hypothetical protein